MPPKRKAKAPTNKEIRETIEARQLDANEHLIGTRCEEVIASINNFDRISQVYIDMKLNTGEIKGVLICFYNGRGSMVGGYLTNAEETEEEYHRKIGKLVKYGIDQSMLVPADECTDVNHINIEGIEWLSPDEKQRLLKKASVKNVSCVTGALQQAPPNTILLTPWSCVTNNSNLDFPEKEHRVIISLDDEEILGKAILQRSVFAINREEAKYMIDRKYHGERAKWADV